MKKFLISILTLSLIITTIPCLALFGKPNDLSSPQDTKIGNYLIYDTENDKVLSLTPNEYVRGVVAAEMPIDYSVEALKAQAVAAHTYALRQIGQELKNPTPELKGCYLSTDYTKYQAYVSDEKLKEKWGKNFNTNYKKLCDAVDAVADKIIVLDNKPIIATFHAISYGQTEDAQNIWGRDVSYLKSTTSEGDELSPEFEATKVFSLDELKTALTSYFGNLRFGEDATSWINITKRSDVGTVLNLTVCGKEVSGTDIRSALKLRSANFDFEIKDNSFSFTTKGYGHCVGLSQYGADFLARQGKTYEEILLHYYTGVSIISKNEEASEQEINSSDEEIVL